MKASAHIAFVEFLRPDSFWPYPYSIEQAFEVFRWLATTGLGYERPTRWGMNGPIELLSDRSSCTNSSFVKPIKSLDDLRRRFHLALLGNATSTTGADEWREAHDIRVGADPLIKFRHNKPMSGGAGWSCESDIRDALNKLFADGAALKTKESLNPYHLTARTCKSIAIGVGANGFHFIMEYGWPDEECTSHWFKTLARTEYKETFLDTLKMAIDTFYALV
jgi:hypothetical protein